MDHDYDKLLKCIFIGDMFVGKTSLCNKLVNYEVPISYQSTIGVDFFCKMLDINNKKIKLQIWDTTGQERYRSITRSYYRNTGFVFLIFDLTNIRTFLNIKTWLNDINKNCYPNIKKVLIGNKNDLKPDISIEEINILCEENDIKYYSCCAKKDNIEDFIKNIVVENLDDVKFHNMKIYDSTVNLNKKNQTKCCNIL
jgi:small GTP-binding protein